MQRVPAPSSQAFAEYVRAGQPIVLEAAVRHWHAVSSWSTDYLRAKVGAKPVPVEIRTLGNLDQNARFEEIAFETYLGHMEAGRKEYFLSNQKLEEVLPELADDVARPSVLSEGNPYVFFGKDTFAAMHYHATAQAMLCQVVGKKRLLLFSPQDFHRIYPESWFSPRFIWSRVDFSQPDPDLARFPALREAQPYECLLEPGDALFIPVHWWHATYGLDRSFSISYFWRAAWREWRLPSPGIRSFVGHHLDQVVYTRAQRIKALESLYYWLRRRRRATESVA